LARVKNWFGVAMLSPKSPVDNDLRLQS